MPQNHYGGMDLTCPGCCAAPGERCRNGVTGKYIPGRRVHASRVQPGTTPQAHYSAVQRAEAPVLTIGRLKVLPCQLETYLSRLAEPDSRGCILWTAGTDAHGYGAYKVVGGMAKTHQIAWVLKNGPMPDGLEPDHTCEVERCCNADHLEAVTHAENARRTGERRTHCLSGRHLWSEQEPVFGKNGKRECRLCRNENKRRWHHLNKNRMAS